jgi:hypothetical protein
MQQQAYNLQPGHDLGLPSRLQNCLYGWPSFIHISRPFYSEAVIPPLLYYEQLPRFTAVVVVARCVGFSGSCIGWLASCSWSWWIHGVPAGNVEELHARTVLGLLNPRRLQMTYHAAGGGCLGVSQLGLSSS